MRNATWKRAVGLIFALIAMVTSSFAWGAVEDNAALFSKPARDKANEFIREFGSQHHLQIVVRTEAEVPVDTKAAILAQKMVSDRKISGFLALIVLKPKRQLATVFSPQMGNLLMHPDEPRLKMLAAFQREDFDGGLDALLMEIKDQVASAQSTRLLPDRGHAGGLRDVPAREQKSKVGYWILAGFVGIVLLGAILMFVARRSRGPSGPGLGGPGSDPGVPFGGSLGGGSGGGGWVKPVVGGIAGAMAGNWLYDQLTGRGHAHADTGSTGAPQGGDNWSNSDAGQIGGSFGGTGGDDWGGTSGSDSSSSGGGDMDTGSSSSGGDDW